MFCRSKYSIRRCVDIRVAGKYIFLGGTSSGKSLVAERTISSFGPEIRYLATAPAKWGENDLEFASRIAKHKERRDHRWHLIELTEPRGLYALISKAVVPTLIDSVGVWLAADPTFEPDLDLLEDSIIQAAVPLVFVSEEAGLGLLPIDRVSRSYLDRLGAVNQRISRAVDRSFLVVAGQLLELSSPEFGAAR